MNDTINNLSPLDGRYQKKTQKSRANFSEKALIKARLLAEIEWLSYFLSAFKPDLKDTETSSKINELLKGIPDSLIARVKEIEKTTNHDVKAVEVALAEEFKHSEKVQSLIHVFLTSEDINSLSYALMLKNAHIGLLGWVEEVVAELEVLAQTNKDLAMMSRTHGQPASPTTLGKEINVFLTRIKKEHTSLLESKFYAKWGGATANYNPHLLAFPDEDWVSHSKEFLKHLDIELTVVATQIEPHDYMAELFQNIQRINTIILDLNRDIWTYISLDYFSLKMSKNEVGSSTMPHKVNPIDFENSEGNIGLANSIFDFLSNKLPKSRLQRDLSDSTVMRNIGVPFGHSLISFESILKGLNKIYVNEDKINKDIEENWIVVSEAIQTILRREGYSNPYEIMKELTRNNQKIDKKTLHKFIDELKIDDTIKKELKQISPYNYTGI